MNLEQIQVIAGTLNEIKQIVTTVMTNNSHTGSMGESYITYTVYNQDGERLALDCHEEHRSNYAHEEPSLHNGSQTIWQLLDSLDNCEGTMVITVAKEWLDNWEGNSYVKGKLTFTYSRFRGVLSAQLDEQIEYTDGSSNSLSITLGDDCQVVEEATYPQPTCG